MMAASRADGRRGHKVWGSARANRFEEYYGPWALVAGASEGLGAAYARALAERGMSLLLVARRRSLLDELAEELRSTFGVEVRCCDGDLAAPEFLQTLLAACSGLDLGLVVYNASHAPIGEFTSLAPEDLMRVVAVNIRAPVALLSAFLPRLAPRCRAASTTSADRQAEGGRLPASSTHSRSGRRRPPAGRGAGVVLMTSLAGNQGSPRIATYAASKAFTRVLAEGLWHELKDQGIDVVACCAGAVRTPGYAVTAGEDAPGTLNPQEVVEQALAALGHGPLVIPGLVNRVAAVFMARLLPRRAAVKIMARSTRGLAPAGAHEKREGATAGSSSQNPAAASTAARPEASQHKGGAAS